MNDYRQVPTAIFNILKDIKQVLLTISLLAHYSEGRVKLISLRFKLIGQSRIFVLGADGPSVMGSLK